MSTAAICRTPLAGVSIDDRAFVFGDGVYEVCEVRAGAMIDAARHLARLARSLAAIAHRRAARRSGAPARYDAR